MGTTGYHTIDMIAGVDENKKFTISNVPTIDSGKTTTYNGYVAAPRNI